MLSSVKTVWTTTCLDSNCKKNLLAEQIYCIYFWTFEQPEAVSVLYYIPEELPNGQIRAQWGVPTTYGDEGIVYKAYRHYVPNGKTGLIEGKRERLFCCRILISSQQRNKATQQQKQTATTEWLLPFVFYTFHKFPSYGREYSSYFFLIHVCERPRRPFLSRLPRRISLPFSTQILP